MSVKERFIEAYVHHGRIGVLLELSAASHVTMQTEAFVQLARDLAMHIAASSPQDIDELRSQPFVKNTQVTVGERIAELSSALRERLDVVRFVRWDTEFRMPEPEPTPPRDPAVAVRLKVVK